METVIKAFSVFTTPIQRITASCIVKKKEYGTKVVVQYQGKAPPDRESPQFTYQVIWLSACCAKTQLFISFLHKRVLVLYLEVLTASPRCGCHSSLAYARHKTRDNVYCIFHQSATKLPIKECIFFFKFQLHAQEYALVKNTIRRETELPCRLCRGRLIEVKVDEQYVP